MVQERFDGHVRLQVTIISETHVRLQWFNSETDEVIWTEECKPNVGVSFVAQIEGKGLFQPRPGYFVGLDGKRHFVMNAEPGMLGAGF